MASLVDTLFSADDVKRIEDAVRQAEQQTAGEIVPYVVHESDSYDEALWRAGAASGVLGLTALTVFHNFSSSWQPFEFFHVLLVTLGSALAGALVARFVNPVKRFFAGTTIMERRVAQRAAEAFVSEEVFQTRDRTGILILLSLLERKVIILGDSGINAKVEKSEWEGIASTIVKGMRTSAPAHGLVEAIGQCGKLLSREGVTIRPDDKNEISNRLRKSDQ